MAIQSSLANAEYKKYFTQRLADHLYTTFNAQRMLKRIDYHQQLIEAEYPGMWPVGSELHHHTGTRCLRWIIGTRRWTNFETLPSPDRPLYLPTWSLTDFRQQ